MAVLKVRQNGEWVVVGTGEKGEKGDTGNIKDLDTSLSLTSTNAVQNKVITQEVNSIKNKTIKRKTIIGGTELLNFLQENFKNVISMDVIMPNIGSITTNESSFGGGNSTGSVFVSGQEYVFVPSYKYTSGFYFLASDNNYFVKLGVFTPGGLSIIINGILLSSGNVKVVYGTSNLPATTSFDVAYYEN